MQEIIPRYPFHIVAMDLFEYAGKDFIALIDSYSGYNFGEQIKNKTSGCIILYLRSIFNIVGYPTNIKCDNNPFSSAEFGGFATECNIQFKFLSPRYPQSNGLAEKSVAIVKNILKRCFQTNTINEFQYRLLEYNTTPVASMGLSPSELFFSRTVKTKLPISDGLLVRNNIEEQYIHEKIQTKRERHKYYYDCNAKSLPKLTVGDLVIFQKKGKEWHYGYISSIVNDRSYIVCDSIGNCYRRNRRFIAKTKNSIVDSSDLLFEENIKKVCTSQSSNSYYNNCNSNNDNNCKEISIVVPPNREDRSEMYIAEQAMDLPIPESSTDDGVLDIAMSEEVESNLPPSGSADYRTGSSRLIKPPQRYDG